MRKSQEVKNFHKNFCGSLGLTKEKNLHIIGSTYEKDHDGDSILVSKAKASRGWWKPGVSRARGISLPSCALNRIASVGVAGFPPLSGTYIGVCTRDTPVCCNRWYSEWRRSSFYRADAFLFQKESILERSS